MVLTWADLRRFPLVAFLCLDMHVRVGASTGGLMFEQQPTHNETYSYFRKSAYERDALGSARDEKRLWYDAADPELHGQARVLSTGSTRPGRF